MGLSGIYTAHHGRRKFKQKPNFTATRQIDTLRGFNMHLHVLAFGPQAGFQLSEQPAKQNKTNDDVQVLNDGKNGTGTTAVDLNP